MADPIVRKLVDKFLPKQNPKGPLAALDSSRFKKAETLCFPIDLAAGYKNYIKFNISIPERSQYTASFSAAASQGTAAEQNNAERGIANNPIGPKAAAAIGTAVGVAGFLKSVVDKAKKLDVGQVLSTRQKVFSAISGIGQGGAAGLVAGSISLDRQVKKISQTIYMYVPDTVQSIIKPTYEDVSLREALGNSGTATAALNAVGSMLTGNDPRGGGRSAVTAELLGKLAESSKVGDVNVFGSGIGKAAIASAGLAANPMIEVLFQSMPNREFQFDFKMTPKNKREAEEILTIIKAFRFHAAPELFLIEGAAWYMVPPSVFDIEFMFDGKQNSALPKISTCVLQGVDVNYSPGGQFATYEDGIPVEITMQLFFKETEILRKSLIDEGY